MDIRFNGSLDLATIRRAVGLIGKSPLWAVILRAALAILVVLVLGDAVFSIVTKEDVSTGRLIRNVLSSLVIGYFVIQPYLASRQLFKALSSGSQQQTGIITALGISYNVGASRSVDYAWNDFYHVFKADDLIVLATADSRISILNRSLFATEQDWKYFVQYADTRVKPVK